MKRRTLMAAAVTAALAASLAQTPVSAQEKPIRIGVPTAVQLQVGRDTQAAVEMAIEDINAKGGVLGRKLEIVMADETELPETGINAIKKLTAEDKVDVMIGGYTSGVTLAQLPHISRAKTIYLGVGAASPAITQRVKKDYDDYKYIFRVGPIHSGHQARQVTTFLSDFVGGQMGYKKVAIVGENAKWVQDLVPILKKGATEAGVDVTFTELFDTKTSDFSPLFSKVRDSGAQFLTVILSHASSDVFAKQWHDSQVPMPYGGIDVKSMDGDFCSRIDGKAISEIAGNFAVSSPITSKTVPFFEAFTKRTQRQPVYTAYFAHDAVNLYAAAVTKAGSTDPDKVIKALEETSYEGIAGIIEFDEMHDVKAGGKHPNLLFAQWRENCDRQVVFPPQLKTADPILPPWLKK
jgi:branched-chain amino acid transport system substrate-binding protein